MVLQKNDVLFAHIALNLVPGLSSNARRVAGAIVEHFNKRTTQCDPSIERLAKMLGIDRATVMRATAELCKTDDQGCSVGLFERVTHGGRSHRTSYLPRWDRLNEIVDDWDMRMKDGDGPSKVAKLRRSRSQSCDVNSRRTATQTDRRNLQKKPTVPVSLSEPDDGQPSPPQSRIAPKGLSNESARPQGQRTMLLALPGGKASSRTDAATAGAMRRIIDPIRRSNPALAYKIDLEATPAMLDEAAAAEAKHRGAGLPHLLTAIDEQALEARRC